MESATETERKYDVPADFTLPTLTGAVDAVTHDLDATYFDTDDLRLAHHGLTLRRRTGGTDAGWHLKTPAVGHSRTEHRLPLTANADEVPAEMRSAVRAVSRRGELRPVARLRTTRVETPLRDADGRTLALIAQDRVTAETDDGEQRWQEVEVELVDGDAKLLKTVQKKLLAAGASPAAGPSKLARALSGRLRTRRPDKIKDPVLAYAREQRAAIAEHDPGVREGHPESVHRMRVATRRLRSTLKTFRAQFDQDRAVPLREELKWLAEQLGAVRDGQVLQRKLLRGIQEEGAEFAPVADRVRTYLEEGIREGTGQLREALDGERYLSLLDAVDELVAGPTPDRRGERRRARKVLLKADRLLDEATLSHQDEPLHEARKAYKQARYAVEVFGRDTEPLAEALTDLQDVLGAHQDSVVARELLRDLATDGDGFRYGVLYARQELLGRDTLLLLPAMIEASRKAKVRAGLG